MGGKGKRTRGFPKKQPQNTRIFVRPGTTRPVKAPYTPGNNKTPLLRQPTNFQRLQPTSEIQETYVVLPYPLSLPSSIQFPQQETSQGNAYLLLPFQPFPEQAQTLPGPLPGSQQNNRIFVRPGSTRPYLAQGVEVNGVQVPVTLPAGLQENRIFGNTKPYLGQREQVSG